MVDRTNKIGTEIHRDATIDRTYNIVGVVAGFTLLLVVMTIVAAIGIVFEAVGGSMRFTANVMCAYG